MTTPKSQNPEGKVVAVGYISPEALAALNACRNDEHNGCADIWMRPVNVDDVPLIPATALAAMQRRLEAAEALAEEYADLKFRLGAGSWTYEQRIALGKECDAAREQLRTFLHGDGNGDGVSTAEGEGR